MIIYRKSKEYKKEKALIVAGMRAFVQFHQINSRLTVTKKITSLSNAILKATGLADKKGKLINTREPLGRWQKRKKVVEKKLKT